ncbi:MAG TPA: LacI family DNA-binding transcriptional regulator [Vicinamibacterales bacterium]|nr:LacI family DNA-binding transcriptional regulator [Vicinamibacterales bacterium]
MNIAEIARKANVSTATVSRTLNQSGPVKAATARKVWRAVTALSYYPNSHARALVSGRSRLIGLIVSDITNPFFPELIRRFEDLAGEQRYDLLITSTNYQTARMTACLRRILERKIDGVAIMTSEMDLGLVKELARRSVPIVFMDVGQVGPRMSHVAIDYGNGIAQAVDHVVALGHRHVAFISGPLDLHSARTRRQAFVDGMHRHGLRPDRRFIREGTHTAEGGEKAMTALLRLRRLPTAVVTSNDWTAIGALHAILAAGLRVPDDISLVGFDDIPLVSYTNPALTTVRMSAADVGATAFQALFRLIRGDRPEGDVYQVPTRLVVRESTTRARAERS